LVLPFFCVHSVNFIYIIVHSGKRLEMKFQEFYSFCDLDLPFSWKDIFMYCINCADKSIPEDYRMLTVDVSTPVAMFMPSHFGLGLCAVALVSFLCRIQNDFMEQYSILTKQT